MDGPGLTAIDLVDQLPESAVTLELATHLLSVLPTDIVGLLIYGSRARSDFTASSDLDALALVATEQGTVVHGELRVSCYTRNQLESASGTLFGAHLQRDGIVVYDTGGTTSALLAAMGPVDAERVLRRVHDYAALLDPEAIDIKQYLGGVVRLGRYLLRSAMYADTFLRGPICFSVREIAVRYGDPHLVGLLSSHLAEQSPADESTLREIRQRLSDQLGKPLPPNLSGSVAALATADWDRNRERATLAILAMSEAGADPAFDYSELPKVLL